MNKNDLRFIKTEKLIKSAFYQCVKEMGARHVTILAICQEAMISRNTFYAHYLDINDLVDHLFSELENEILGSSSFPNADQLKIGDITSGMDWYIDTVIDNHEKIRILLYFSSERFSRFIFECIVAKPMRGVIENFDELMNDLLIKLNVNYMFQAMIAFTNVWLENFDKLTREQVYHELGELCKRPCEMYFEKVFNHPDVKYKKINVSRETNYE